MVILSYRVSCDYDEKYGLSSYMCWKESGMHIYTWDKILDFSSTSFFSIDIYTCKNFNINDVINFTSTSFSIKELTWKE